MQAETIYKGATRPAMKLGIPLVPLVARIVNGARLSDPAVNPDCSTGFGMSLGRAMLTAVTVVPALA